jgi:preprotein translocase subunit YajC
MLLLVVMFGIFYFLMIRPQQKKQRELQDWLKTLKKDDEVITSGGLWGKIKGVSESSPYITLELQEKVRVRILRSHITAKAPAADQPAAEQNKP